MTSDYVYDNNYVRFLNHRGVGQATMDLPLEARNQRNENLDSPLKRQEDKSDSLFDKD